jgi:hypothetical protein
VKTGERSRRKKKTKSSKRKYQIKEKRGHEINSGMKIKKRQVELKNIDK